MKKINLLKLITKTMATTVNHNVVFELISSELRNLLKIDLVEIRKLNNLKGNPKLKIISKNIDNNSENYLKDLTLNKEIIEYICKYVLKKGRPLIINNIEQAELPDFYKKFLLKYNVKSLILMPIQKDNEVWGLISLYQIKNVKNWTKDEIKFLFEIVDYISISIRQTELSIELKKTKRYMDAIINNLPFNLWIKDANNKYVVSNESFAKYCNLKAEEVIGKTDFEIWPEYIAKAFIRNDKKIMKTGHQEMFIEKEITPEGEVWAEIYKKPVFNEHGKVIGTTGFRNLSVNKKIEEMKKEFTSLNNIDKVYEYTLNKLYENFNPNLLFLVEISNNNNEIKFEYSSKDNHYFSKKLKSLENNETFYNYVSEITKNMKLETIEHIKIFKEKNIDLFNLLNNYNIKSCMNRVILKPGNHYDKFNIVFLCFNQKRTWSQYEKELFEEIINYASSIISELNQKKETESTKNTFIATLTHDLRSPIIAEQKGLEFLLSRKDDSPVGDIKEYLIDIYKTNEDLLQIVNNILTVYHIESGKFSLNIENSSIEPIIKNAVRSLHTLAEEKKTEIEVQTQENLPEIPIDPNEIRRVLINLISNAIKHTKKETKIKVKAELTNNYIQISISDNGQGISEEDKPKIFQRYPTKKRKIGSGLGLFLSKQIIEAHNGRIWFESELNKGTTFYFTLPIK